MKSIIPYLFFLITTALAVFNDEAFITDWKIKQIGPLNSENILYPRLEILNLLTRTNTLAGIKNGDVRWRVKFNDLKENSTQKLVEFNNSVVTALNYDDRCVIQVWDAFDGFWIKDLATFPDKEIKTVGTLNDGIIVVFTNGEVVLINDDINLLGSISKFDEVRISTLMNGNVIILFNEKDTENTHYSFFNAKTSKFNTHTLQISWSSIKEFHGAKLIYHTVKYYALKFDKVNGVVSSPIPISGNFEKFIPLETDSLVAFEKDHNLELFKLDDFSKPSFIIPNVHKYQLKFAEDSLVLYTEYHANIIDADTGDEIKSYFLGPEALPFDLIKSISATTDGVDTIHTFLEFANSSYSYIFNDKETWKRDASLSQIVDHTIVEFEYETSLSKGELLYEEKLNVIDAYVYRLTKHTKELKALYEKFWDIVPKVATGDLSFFSSESKDEYFGFKKFLVLATRSGRVIALNTLNGEQVWSYDIQQDDILKIECINNEKIIVFTKSGPKLQLASKTGELVEKKLIVEPVKVEMIESDKFYIEIANEFGIVYSESELNSTNFLVKHDFRTVQGLKIEGKKVLTSWKFETNIDEEIVAFSSKDKDEKIANVGYVLGDRSVLYKYLYPNLAAFAVLNKPTKTLYIHIIDTLTGEVIHSTYHDEQVHEDEKINILFGEHWVIYSYWSNLPYPEQKIVVIDLFESLTPNERFSNETTSALDFRTPPAILSKAFILPFKINSMAISKTKFGVTTKSIIISLTNGQIFYLPKFILNSRRVSGRELTAAEKSEYMLLPYDPILTIDDNFVISHQRQILGTDQLISIPTNLESTSIVCSYGLDVFCTRISPSLQFDKLTPSFDKLKLLTSIAVLIIVVLVLKPLKESRNLKALWVIES